MSASQVDPHDKMRARDVNRVARGEQAPRPAHEYGTVSPPPPPSSTDNIHSDKNKAKKSGAAQIDYQTRQCYAGYVDYHRCLEEKGKNARECEKLASYLRTSCPNEWIAEWDKEREEGDFPDAI